MSTSKDPVVSRPEWLLLAALASVGAFIVAGEMGAFREEPDKPTTTVERVNQVSAEATAKPGFTITDPSYGAGFKAGMIYANRKTIDRAMALLDTFKVPINSLNAADVIGIIGECALPRERPDLGSEGVVVEWYEDEAGKPVGMVSIRLNRERLVDPQKTNDGWRKMIFEQP